MIHRPSVSVVRARSRVELRVSAAVLAALGATVSAQRQFEELPKRGLPVATYKTSDVALGDLDGDGDLDAITTGFSYCVQSFCGGGGQNRMFRNDGNGVFEEVTLATMPLTFDQTLGLALGDVDGDGDLDLIVTGEWSYNLVLINDGRGKFADETMARLPLKRHDSEDIAIADFDGDSDLDLIFVSEDDEVNEYYLNDGRGYFEDHAHKLPVTGKSNAVVSFDINEDGYPDLVIGNNGVNYCLIKDATNNGWIESPDRIPASSKTTQDIEMGDFDGDGDLDLICGNEDDNEVWINDGKGFFKDETAARLPMEPSAWETREVDLGDVDGDGDLDLFLANVNFRQNKDAQNRLFFNDGKGFFRDKTATHLPAEKMHSVDGDFVDIDADGDLDIITGNSFGNSFACYLNDGKGNFVNATDKVLPPSVKGDGIDIEAADFNGDGIIDLYFCNFMGSDLLLLGLQRKR